MSAEERIDNVGSTRGKIFTRKKCSVEKVQNRPLENDGVFYDFKEPSPPPMGSLMQSKILICFCISFYIFGCLFGNIITGLYLFKYYPKSNKIESNISDILISPMEFNHTYSGYSTLNNISHIDLESIEEIQEDIDDLIMPENDDLYMDLPNFNTTVLGVS